MNDTDTIQSERLAHAELRRQTNPLKRVLVADDDDVLRQLIADSLAGYGYDVEAAENGAIAWEALQAKHYDLLITDNSMPEITGIGLVRKLRDHGLTLPVVMATGETPTEDLKRYPSLRITAILLKPYTVKDLLNTVKETLQEPDSAAAKHRLPLFFDSQNICMPVAIQIQDATEKLAAEQPFLRL